MGALAAVDRVPDLDALALTVAAEHKLTVTGIAATLEHAIRCGEAMLLARQQVEPGGWARWYSQLGISKTAAQHYVRLATYRQELIQGGGGALSIGGALAQLKGLHVEPISQGHNRIALPVEALDEMERLHRSGLNVEAIAAKFDLSANTVRRRLDPGFASRARVHKRNHRHRRASQRSEPDLRAERDALMDQADPPIRLVYALAQALVVAIDDLHMDGRAIPGLRDCLRKLEDELASRVERTA